MPPDEWLYRWWLPEFTLWRGGMRLLLVAFVSFWVGGMSSAWLIASDTVSGQAFARVLKETIGSANQPGNSVRGQEFTRERATQIISSNWGTPEETIRIHLGQCAQPASGFGCAQYKECPATVSVADAVPYVSEDAKRLFRAGLVEGLSLDRRSPIFGSPNFYCQYIFNFTSASSQLFRQRHPGNDYSAPTADVVTYRKKFAGVTGIREQDGNTRMVEFMVTFEPTEFAKTIQPNTLHHREQRPYNEIALFTRYDDGWRLVQLGR